MPEERWGEVRRGGRNKQAQVAFALRDEGRTWTEIADVLRSRWPELTPRAAVRLAHGWSQKKAADKWNERWGDKSFKAARDFSCWERWPVGGRRPSLTTLDGMAQVYQCSVSYLLSDIADYSGDDEAGHTDRAPAQEPSSVPDPDVCPPQPAELGRVDEQETADRWPVGATESHLSNVRRQGTVLTAMGMPSDLGGLLSLTESPQRLLDEHLLLLESPVMALEQRDAATGGGAALDMAVTVHDRMSHWLQHTAPDMLTVLQTLYCELGALIGWLAYDAGQPALARQSVNEVMALARFTDATNADLRAMNTLCLLLSDSGRPQEALQCAEQAHRVADGRATLRTRALLRVRSARTHAKLGSFQAFRRELALAEDLLQQAGSEQDESDPPWVRFLDQSELAAVVGGSYLLLGQPDRAVDAYRTAVEASEPAAARNTTSRTVWLADALLRQGDVAQASTTALGVVPEVSTLSSARVVKRLHRLRRTVDRYTASMPAAADFAEAYDGVFAA